jgi:hypothetical protein
MTTRRQWLFQNPPPHTAEVYDHALREAREGLRDAVAETSSLVVEMFAASSLRALKSNAGKESLKQKVKGFLADREKSKKLLDLAKSFFEKRDGVIVIRDDFEERGGELLDHLNQFQTEKSRELVHYVRETRLWREKIASVREKMVNAAQCPIDSAPLMRTRNRKEDLFVCTAPIVEDRPQHYFLWTIVDGNPAFQPIDFSKNPTLPDIDGPMEVENAGA